MSNAHIDSSAIDAKMNPADPAELIRLEARAMYASIGNGVRTRKSHPTYGVLKSDLSAKLHNLEGLLYAYVAVVEGDRSAHFASQVAVGAAALDFDLTALRNDIKNS